MKTIVEDIRNKTIRKFYLFYGTEAYLKKQYKEKLKEAVVTDGNTMNLSVFRENKTDVSELLSICNTMPFFSERRLVIVEDSGFFKKAPEGLVEGLADIADTSCLLFVESEVDKRGRLFKLIQKQGYATEFSLPNEHVLKQWLLKKLKMEGKQISANDLDYLLSLMPQDMNAMSMEMEKLLCYTLHRDQICREDIDAVLSHQLENQIFEMISAISAGEEKKALGIYYQLLELKEAPLKLLALLEREYRILFDTKSAVVQGISGKEIAAKLHMNPYIIKKYVQSSHHFELPELKRALLSCAETEQRIKTGKINDMLGTEILMIRLLSGHKK